jgi:hypothetical protein
LINEVHIRSWKPEDASELAAICNNKQIWLNVRDGFPHPYTVGNAVEWIRFSLTQQPIQNMAIIYQGCIAGSIGVIPKEDVYRKNIEVGYFIGESYWRRNPFIRIANGSRKKGIFEKENVSNGSFKISTYRHQSLHKGHQPVGCRAKGEDIQKHAKQFLKQAGGVLLQRQSHAA